MDSMALRDHAGDLLIAIVNDMGSALPTLPDTRFTGHDAVPALNVRGASEDHAIGRLSDGFDLLQVVSEYGSLRISVLALWDASHPVPADRNVADVAMFNASIDKSLATAVHAYTRRVEESRNMFLAILSHDLRNPLGSIAMSAHLLPRSAVLSEQSSGLASQISASVGVMSQMISDLLDYTRTRLGAGMPIQRVTINLADVATEVVAEFRSSHPDATLLVDLDGDLTGDWDAARLRQVLSNLVGNAFQHGDRLAPISVRLVAQNPDRVSIAIRNQGNPISPAEIPRIFDPLVRGATANQPRQNRPGSIGLGLYIARELVLAHGGDIAVTSDAETGTCFTVRLPRHPLAATLPTGPAASLTPPSVGRASR